MMIFKILLVREEDFFGPTPKKNETLFFCFFNFTHPTIYIIYIRSHVFVFAHKIDPVQNFMIPRVHTHRSVSPHLNRLGLTIEPNVGQIRGLVRDRVEHRAVLANHKPDVIRGMQVHLLAKPFGRGIVELGHVAIRPLESVAHVSHWHVVHGRVHV